MNQFTDISFKLAGIILSIGHVIDDKFVCIYAQEGKKDIKYSQVVALLDDSDIQYHDEVMDEYNGVKYHGLELIKSRECQYAIEIVESLQSSTIAPEFVESLSTSQCKLLIDTIFLYNPSFTVEDENLAEIFRYIALLSGYDMIIEPDLLHQFGLPLQFNLTLIR